MLYFRPSFEVKQTLIVRDQLRTIQSDELKKGFKVVHITPATFEKDMFWVTSIKVESVTKKILNLMETEER